MSLTNDQQIVAEQFMDFMMEDSQSHMVLSGFAGTGKSFLTHDLIRLADKQHKLISLLVKTVPEDYIDIRVTATTNKAARVIADMVGSMPQTIHSLLNITPVTDYKTGKTKLRKTKDYFIRQNSLIIIDEASLIDTPLLEMIQNSTMNCKTLFIGDPYQLAPIYETSSPVFSLPCRQSVLTEVVRNPGPIEQLAGLFRSVLDGEDWPDIQENGKEILKVDGSTFQALINKEYLRVDRRDDDARILAWSNSRVIQYNEYVRGIQGYGEHLQVGEKVISNNYMPGPKISVDQHLMIREVGSVYTQKEVEGRAISVGDDISFFIPLRNADMQQVLKFYAKQQQWGDYYHIKENWGDLRPFHASTVHKSQGSTYGKVFIDLEDIGRCTIKSDVARLLYVAISRAKDQVIFYGRLPSRYSNKGG